MIVVERSFKYLNTIKLDSLKGFGEKRYSSLKKSNLKSVTDLIRFYPRKHIDRSKVKLINEISQEDQNQEVTIIGSISNISVFTTKTRLRITTLTINDESGSVKAKWFGPQYIETRYKTVFWLIGLSLVLLSIGLASGFMLDLNNVDYLIVKIVFTIMAWITYMTTFIRMRYFNLQTKFIVRYSFLSIIFIMIAFFVNI